MKENRDFRNYYRIIDKIGSGSLGEVYKVKHILSNEIRAIKIIDIQKIFDEFINENFREPSEEEMKKYKANMLKGIKIMKLIQDKNKDNTVLFYEYFKNDREFAIVMELCDCNLGSFLYKGKDGLKPEEILLILTQLNNIFKIIYENKIVYKNLNLTNILLKYENKEKTKFKIKLDSYSLTLQTNNLNYNLDSVGTIGYMAPEILRGGKYNQKCDLWSLGIIIYLLYFKQYPYISSRNTKNLGNICIKKTKNKELDDLLEKLIVSDPEKRIAWKDYFEHPFFKNNNNDNSENKKQNEKIINKGENEEINELKKLLQNEKNKNDDLIKEINKLESENKILEERVNKLKLELDNSIKKLKTNKMDKNLNNNESLNKLILEKDKKIKELEIKLKRYPFELNEGEKLITINFSSIDQKVQNYSIICKNTEIFKIIEKKLYEDYKKYYDTQNYFTFNGKTVDKLKTLKENGIKNNDVIVINVYDL